MKLAIADFLEDRLSEEALLAKAAAGESPEWVYSSEETIDGENVYFTVTAKNGTAWEPDYFLSIIEDHRDADRADHIARWSPARVLADVEAKRAMVRELVFDGAGPREWLLRQLAAPYASHPKYRQEWKP